MDCPEYPLAEIAPDPNQPRQVFSEAHLAELTESIKARGVLQPIVITHNADPKTAPATPYLILYGECRYRASLAAGLTSIPALLEDATIDPAERLLRQLAENDVRQDLTLFERASSLARLLDSGTYTRQELSDKLGKTRNWLNKMVSIAAFQGPALEAVSTHVIARMETAARFSRLSQESQKVLLATARSRCLPITAAIVASAEERRRRIEQARIVGSTTLRIELALPEIHHLLALAGLPPEPTLKEAAAALKNHLLEQVPLQESAS
jgi:ParB family chromosome partitioning protein